MNVLITGGTGFVGSALLKKLENEDFRIRLAVRSIVSDGFIPASFEQFLVSSLSNSADYSNALSGVDTLVHLAARAHVLEERSVDPFIEYRKVNVIGTERLARQAVEAGVRRIVFLSSIKVNGEGRLRAYTENDRPEAKDPYGVSKQEAEDVLWKVAAETGLEVVVIRPPLVYGPSVKANFLRLLEMVDRGIPLPLGGIRNQRSLVYLGNLVDAIILCMKHPIAAGQTYLMSDGEDVSTPELIRRLAASLGKPARLIPFPPGMLRLAGRFSGKSTVVERLVGSLQVDSSKIRRELGWVPPFTLEQGLRETAEWYMRQARGNGR